MRHVDCTGEIRRRPLNVCHEPLIRFVERAIHLLGQFSLAMNRGFVVYDAQSKKGANGVETFPAGILLFFGTREDTEFMQNVTIINSESLLSVSFFRNAKHKRLTHQTYPVLFFVP